jgi:diaminopimelate epimerase
MTVAGKVHLIGQTETVGNNGFTKRQIVVETSEQYPQKVAIDFVKDKCSI